MRRLSRVPHLLPAIAVVVGFCVVAAPASAQRLRSPSSSLLLGTPSVTCGTTPQVHLAWLDSANTPTASYSVMSKTTGAKQNAWSQGAPLGDVATATVSVANNTSFDFAIRAVTSVTRDSNVVSVGVNCAPTDKTPPGTPAITSLTATSCSSTSIAWTTVTDTGGSGLAGYNLYRGSTFIKRVAGTSTTDTGPSPQLSYTYQVSAIDNAGNQSAKSAAAAVVTPACTNTPPIANAGPDQTALSLVTVNFNGSGSSDPGGSISSYSWTFGDGWGATGVAVSHAYGAPGVYTATLTVTDNLGATASDSATITITNRAPTANAGPDQSVAAGTPLTLSGSGSDADGSIASYAWTFGDGGSASGATVAHSWASAGTYTATLTVTDNKGAKGSDTATITVGSVANRPPVANAGADQSSSVGATVSFNGSGSSDPDGSIASYLWNFGDGTLGSGVTTSHAYAAAGTYTVTLTVTDNKNATGTDTAVVTVSTATSSFWAKSFGNVDSDSVYATAVDASGNVYVVGSFNDSITIGGTTLTSAGAQDIVLVKYSPAGQVLWAKRYGSANTDTGYAIAVNASVVVVTGNYNDTTNLGGGTLTSVRTASGTGSVDMFLTEYNASDGTYKWAKSFGGVDTDQGKGVAMDSTGNIYLTGFFIGTINFGGSTLKVPFDSDLDVFIAKFTNAGVHVWSKNWTNNGNDQAYGIAVTPAGDIAIGGAFSNTINFGGANLTAVNAMTDGFIARFDTNGNHVWSKQIGGAQGDEQVSAVAFDSAKNVVAAGTAVVAVDFGGGSVPSFGSSDGWIAKYGATSGAYMWANRFGGLGGDYAWGVAVDSADNAYVAGQFYSASMNVGGITVSQNGTSGDGVLAKYSSTGVAQWARDYGGTNADVLRQVSAGGGAVVTGGYFYGTATMQGTVLTSAGVADGVVIRAST